MINIDDIKLASFGGLLIGIATTIHYLFLGKVTGFSGIYYSIVTLDRDQIIWKTSLLAAVALSSSIMYIKYGAEKLLPGASGPLFDNIDEITKIGVVGAILSGFLVGFGTKLGNGCTSGHGVCGLPRLSIRSSMAVFCFMTFGIITATLKSKCKIIDQLILQDYEEQYTPVIREQKSDHSQIAFMVSEVLIVVCLVLSIFKKQLVDTLFATLVGFIFGLGLVISGMVKRSKIIGFLTLNDKWDPSLIFVMLVAVGFNFITFRLLSKPVLRPKFSVASPTIMFDSRLVIGEIIFGIGWGIGGLCPGPAIALFPQFTFEIGVLFLGSLAIGQISSEVLTSLKQKIH